MSESVVDIFDAVGLDKPNIGFLDEEFFKFSEMLSGVITRYQNRSIETA